MINFVDADRDQTFLLTPEVCAFAVNTRGGGSSQYNSYLMLALLIYCYANGICSASRIERATYLDVAVRFVAANTDHDTIATFQRRNEAAFLEVLLLLTGQLRLFKIGTVSVDGTKIDANASKHKSVRYDRTKVLGEKLQANIAERVTKAESADAAGDDDLRALPAKIVRREHLKAQIRGRRRSSRSRGSCHRRTVRV